MGSDVDCPVPDCNREFESEEGKNSHVGWSHPSLDKFYKKCENCEVEFRSPPSDGRKYCSNECYSEDKRNDHCTFRLERGDGYPAWWVGNYQAKVHALVVVANGADPHKVFSRNGYHVDHINGCKLDNRPENLQVIDRSKHGEKSRPLNVKHSHMRVLKVVENFMNDMDMSIFEALEVGDLD